MLQDAKVWMSRWLQLYQNAMRLYLLKINIIIHFQAVILQVVQKEYFKDKNIKYLKILNLLGQILVSVLQICSEILHLLTEIYLNILIVLYA